MRRVGWGGAHFYPAAVKKAGIRMRPQETEWAEGTEGDRAEGIEGERTEGERTEGSECNQGTVCSICLDPVESQQCHLVCGHVFHSSCILHSSQYDSRCPVCRSELPKKASGPADDDDPVRTELTSAIRGIYDISREIADVRRQQRNWDARRRRVVRLSGEMQQNTAAAAACQQELGVVNREIALEWGRASNAL